MEKLKKGTRVRVTDCKHGHAFKIGQEVKVDSYQNSISDGDYYYYYLTDGNNICFLSDTEFEVIPDEQQKIDLEYWRYLYSGMAMQATDLDAYANKYGNEWAKNVAVDSVEMADALIAELQKGNK